MRPLVVLLVCGLAPGPVSAQATGAPAPASAAFDLSVLRTEGGLLSDDAAERAVATAPSLDRARALVLTAQSAANRAWLAVLPRIDLSTRYTRLSRVDNGSFASGGVTDGGFDDLRALVPAVEDPAARTLLASLVEANAAFTEISFPVLLDRYATSATLSYPVTDLFLTILPSHRAARGAAAAEALRLEAEAQAIRLRAREAYYAYARALGALAVAQSSVAQSEAQRHQVNAMVDAGAAARVDLMRVDAVLAAARVRVAQATGAVAVAAGAVQTLLHLDRAEPLALGEDFSAPPPGLDGTSETLLAEARQARPELRALGLLLEAQGLQLAASEATRYPHVGVSATVDYANPNSRVFPEQEQWNATWAVGAQVSWSPNDLLGASALAAADDAARARTRAEMREIEDALALEVTRAFEDHRAARAALEAAAVGIAAAEESYRVRSEQLLAGTAVTRDLIDAQAERTQARLLLLDAAIDARVAHARLRHAVGADRE